MNNKSWNEVNWATVGSNTFFGGSSIIASSMYESTGSFLNLSANSIKNGDVFNSNGFSEFGTGTIGNIYGNVFGNVIEWAAPGIKEETGKFMKSMFENVFLFGGELSGNIITDKIN